MKNNNKIIYVRSIVLSIFDDELLLLFDDNPYEYY